MSDDRDDLLDKLDRAIDADWELGARVCALLDARAEIARLRRERLSAQVRAFHTAFAVPTRETPGVPDEETVRLRLRLIAEEFFELLEAAGLDGAAPERRTLFALIDEHHDDFDVNLPEFADALADLDYVVEGGRQVFGLDGAPIAAEVHRSNMSKLGADGKPVLRPDGKITKGPNYSPPDIAGELRRQGWRP